MLIDNQTLLQIFYKMLKSRLFEEKIVQLKERGIIADELSLSVGQEATAAAVCALTGDDIVFAPHRNLTIAISCDVSAAALIGELVGLKSGLCSGHSGSMSFADNTVNFYGSSALYGSQFAKAAGVALSLKIQGRSDCVVCFAGDGAAASGKFYETLNFACIKKLPIVFFIENNCYAGKSRFDQIHNVQDIAKRTKAYDIPGIIVDGNSAPDIYEATLKATEYARTDGPILIESKTYRLAGHTYNENQSYRSEDEIKEWLKYDAIENMTAFMTEHGVGISEDFMMIRKKIEDELSNAADYVTQLINDDIRPAVEEAAEDTESSKTGGGV